MAGPIHYRGYVITYDPKPIPFRGCDVDYVHENYDGPEDVDGCGTAASVEDAKAEIDEILEDR